MVEILRPLSAAVQAGCKRHSDGVHRLLVNETHKPTSIKAIKSGRIPHTLKSIFKTCLEFGREFPTSRVNRPDRLRRSERDKFSDVRKSRQVFFRVLGLLG